MYVYYRILADLLKEEEKKKKLAVKLLGSRLEYALFSNSSVEGLQVETFNSVTENSELVGVSDAK